MPTCAGANSAPAIGTPETRLFFEPQNRRTIGVLGAPSARPARAATPFISDHRGEDRRGGRQQHRQIERPDAARHPARPPPR